MKRKHKKVLRPLCAQLHEDDGIAPNDLFRKHRVHKSDHKDLQLCKQVYRVLSTLLAGGFADPMIQSLVIVSVTPAPDASRLLVSVQASKNAEYDADSILARIQSIQAILRIEVAGAVCRRKAPELVYEVVNVEEVIE